LQEIQGISQFSPAVTTGVCLLLVQVTVNTLLV